MLASLGSVYAAVMKARNLAYDRGWLKSHEVELPVLSVGNLSAGGTGKTPITATLVAEFLKRGRHPGLVSRGYGGRERGPIRVSGDEPERFGDEPSWFAQEFPQVPVYVGGDRVADVALMKKDGANVDFVIADDAFQHRRLKRQFDLVLLDATEPRANYRSLPAGRLREGFHSLARASAVFITKTNLAAGSQVAWLRQQIPQGLPVYEWESRLTSFMRGEERVEPSALNEEPVVLASGIGRPEAFRKLVEAETGAKICEHLEFADHRKFTDDDCDQIEAAALESGAKRILITEKDAVKLKNWRPAVEVWVSRLEMRPRETGAIQGFYDSVDGALFSRR